MSKIGGDDVCALCGGARWRMLMLMGDVKIMRNEVREKEEEVST